MHLRYAFNLFCHIFCHILLQILICTLISKCEDYEYVQLPPLRDVGRREKIDDNDFAVRDGWKYDGHKNFRVDKIAGTIYLQVALLNAVKPLRR